MSGSAAPPERAQSRWLVLLAACGMLAPLIYSTSALIASRTYSGFSHLTTFISELGATGAPSAHLMNFGGFLPYGVLVIALAAALHRTLRSAAGGWLGPMLLAVYGLAYVALAFASCDYGCAAAAPSLPHRIHFLLGDLIVVAAVAAPVALYPRMLGDPAWSHWRARRWSCPRRHGWSSVSRWWACPAAFGSGCGCCCSSSGSSSYRYVCCARELVLARGEGLRGRIPDLGASGDAS
jgi:Predicted membrane protein